MMTLLTLFLIVIRRPLKKGVLHRRFRSLSATDHTIR